MPRLCCSGQQPQPQRQPHPQPHPQHQRYQQLSGCSRGGAPYRSSCFKASGMPLELHCNRRWLLEQCVGSQRGAGRETIQLLSVFGGTRTHCVKHHHQQRAPCSNRRGSCCSTSPASARALARC
ncbi:uncharacterized protein LOC144130394 [Amblyomma americanum]